MTHWEEMTAGQKISLGRELRRLRTSIWWCADSDAISIDLVAFILGPNRQVRSNADMVFYNQPCTADKSVVHQGKVCLDGRCTEELSVDLDLFHDDVAGLTIAVCSDGAPLGSITELQWCVNPEPGSGAVTYWAEGLTTERAAVLGELYRQDGIWWLHAAGQRGVTGLAEMAVGYGVTIVAEELS